MSIYRGPGGAGDATTDSTSQAIISVEAAAEAEASAAAAAGSATSASTSASNAATSATNAANSASSASTSATSASNSASAASTSATAAQTAETNAETAQTAAELAETNAETAATNAANSASAASTSATNAASSASSASTSASSAASSASTATTQATNASNSATAAASSATSAATSATNAASSATSASNSATSASTSASTATTQATNAASSATAAATSASSASTSATNASNSASSASTSATNASTSASSASTSATNAASSAAAAAASYDDFDDRYLGSKASAPTLDNDGNALQTGALYFNTSTNTMKVYSGSAWLDAYASLSGALLATNNLSDLNNVATARTNLGLGTAALVADNTLVHLAGTETITGDKTFSSTITGSITGNAGTVTNGVYTSGSYADPTWITSIAGSKVSGNISGNAATATTATNQSGGTVAATTGSFSSSVTLSGGTANGVAYLNGSKVLTTGSGFVYNGSRLTNAPGSDGTNFAVSGATTGVRFDFSSTGTSIYGVNNTFFSSYQPLDIGGSYLTFNTSGSEQMRLTSTGLGIGTSSPSGKLDVYESGSVNSQLFLRNGGTYHTGFIGSSSATPLSDSYAWGMYGGPNSYISGTAYAVGIGLGINVPKFQITRHNNFNGGAVATLLTLDSSGNLGLGVTPSAQTASGIMQLGTGSYITFNNAGGYAVGNAVYNSGWKYQSSNYALSYQLDSNAGAHKWNIAPSGTAGNAITFTQAMTLDASGKLGIGTTSPGFGIDLVGGGGMKVRSNAAYNGAFIEGTSGAAYFGTLSSDPIIFYQNTERMRIDSSGNVGIGNSSPATFNQAVTAPSLVIGAGSNAAGVTLYSGTSNQSSVNFAIGTTTTQQYDGGIIYVPNSGTPYMAFRTNGGTERMRIDSGGNLLFNSGYGSVATAYGCRAWVNFNGTGTVSIRASGNVSSITDLATGNYRINFNTAMPDANYSGVVSGGNGANLPMSEAHEAVTTGYLQIITGGLSTSVTNPVDPSFVHVAVLR